jgi:uncharacterized protein YdeI (YjbR/CyaY-like superfamily)
MELGKTLYVTNRLQWRAWLEKKFDKETEIWLIDPYKSTGKPRISYNDAVEEALCFGWIDSTIKKLDAKSSVRRFSPRRSRSSYSQANKERLRWLLKEKKLHRSVEEEAKRVLREKYTFPPDILEALRDDEQTWKNYKKFSPVYKRIRVAYIDSARSRPGEFKRRLANFIDKTRQNKQIGFGGIEKYY